MSPRDLLHLSRGRVLQERGGRALIAPDSGDESVAGCDSCSFSPDVDLAAASELRQTRPLNPPRRYQVCTDRCSLDKTHTHAHTH